MWGTDKFSEGIFVATRPSVVIPDLAKGLNVRVEWTKFNRLVFGRMIRFLLAICLAAALPLSSLAQKKKAAASPSADDQQKLADAYDVLESLISSGQGRETVTARVGNREGNIDNVTHGQTDVKAYPEKCDIEFDEHDSSYGNNAKGYRHAIVLQLMDLNSFKSAAMKDKPETDWEKEHEDWKRSGEGFVLEWTYLKQVTAGRTFKISDSGPTLEVAGEVFLSSQEDVDRATRALTYAAESCGAHKTAF